MNLTDVDDKTIRNSRAAGEPLEQFTRKFKEAFFDGSARRFASSLPPSFPPPRSRGTSSG